MAADGAPRFRRHHRCGHHRCLLPALLALALLGGVGCGRSPETVSLTGELPLRADGTISLATSVEEASWSASGKGDSFRLSRIWLCAPIVLDGVKAQGCLPAIADDRSIMLNESGQDVTEWHAEGLPPYSEDAPNKWLAVLRRQDGRLVMVRLTHALAPSGGGAQRTWHLTATGVLPEGETFLLSGTVVGLVSESGDLREITLRAPIRLDGIRAQVELPLAVEAQPEIRDAQGKNASHWSGDNPFSGRWIATVRRQGPRLFVVKLQAITTIVMRPDVLPSLADVQ